MAWHLPLDLYYWFVNVFAGNLAIFFALAFVAIAALAAMFRMPTSITLISFGIFIIMLATYLGSGYIIVLLIAGLTVGWILSRFWKT